MKQKLLITYLLFGIFICGWFFFAARGGWRAPNLGFLDGSRTSYGRSFGGAWGGGK